MENNIRHLVWYSNLCRSRQKLCRLKGDGNYYERHHIKPRWMNGSNDNSNLVLLTAKEHYYAHYFLYLYYKDKPSSAAFHKMNNTINNKYRDHKKYTELREFQSKLLSGDNNPSKRKEVIEKISKAVSGSKNGMYGRTGDSNPFYGKTHTKEFIERKKIMHGNPITYNGITYPSLRDAERQTGVSRFLIKKAVND